MIAASSFLGNHEWEIRAHAQMIQVIIQILVESLQAIRAEYSESPILILLICLYIC